VILKLLLHHDERICNPDFALACAKEAGAEMVPPLNLGGFGWLLTRKEIRDVDAESDCITTCSCIVSTLLKFMIT
jgi:hypothetical protein